VLGISLLNFRQSNTDKEVPIAGY